MSSCVYGIANHSPETLIKHLIKRRVVSSPSDIGIVDPGSRVGSKFSAFLFLSVSDLMRSGRTLSPSSKAFVFSNALDLMTVHGITPLDFNVDDATKVEYTELDLSKVCKCRDTFMPPSRCEYSFLDDLIARSQYGSLLTPLMTLIYSLPSAEQGHVKNQIVSILYEGKSIDAIEDVSDKFYNKLLKIVDTDLGDLYRDVFSEIRAARRVGKFVDIAVVAKRHVVASYEISYMLSVYDSAKEKFKNSFDKAKTRRTI